MTELLTLLLQFSGLELGIVALIVLAIKFIPNISFKKFQTYLTEIRISVLKSIIYNENIPVLERLECFNEYLKLGGNGNCRKFAVKIIMSNKELWDSIIKDEVKDKNKYYEDTINEIKRTLA
jgi:hypothetical protein